MSTALWLGLTCVNWFCLGIFFMPNGWLSCLVYHSPSKKDTMATYWIIPGKKILVGSIFVRDSLFKIIQDTRHKVHLYIIENVQNFVRTLQHLLQFLDLGFAPLPLNMMGPFTWFSGLLNKGPNLGFETIFDCWLKVVNYCRGTKQMQEWIWVSLWYK